MSYAKLQIEYERIADVGIEYILRTQVSQLVTTPEALKTCLKVRKGDSGAEERLTSIAEYADIITAPLEDLPATVNIFTAPTLSTIPAGGIAVDDVIEIVTIPFLWFQFFQTSSFSTVVTNVVSSTIVEVATPFPAFARGLTFKVTQLGSVILPTAGDVPPYPSDGVANRDYTGLVGTDFLSQVHHDTWDNLDDAQNKVTSLPAQAQSVVDALNEDNYTGVTTGLYE